jgi:hypothetical protein
VKLVNRLAAVGVTAITVFAVWGGTAVASGGVDGTGAAVCSTGKSSVSFKPALINGGTVVTTVKMKFALTCGSGSGDGLNVTAGSVSGSVAVATNDCNTDLSGATVTGHITAKWKVKPGVAKLNPTVITLTSITGAQIGANNVFHTFGHATSGSFNGGSQETDAFTQMTTTAINAACAAKGVKKLALQPGGDFVV